MRMQCYCQNDKKTFGGFQMDIAISLFSLSQIIKEPAHALSNMASYVYTTFTSRSNLVICSVINPSLHPICHHQIIFANFYSEFFILSFTNDQFVITSKKILILLNDPLIYSFYSFLDGYSVPFRFDRNGNGSEILLYIRNNLPSKLLSIKPQRVFSQK